MYLRNQPGKILSDAFRRIDHIACNLSRLLILCLLSLVVPAPGVALETNTPRRVHFREPHHTHYILIDSSSTNQNGKLRAANAVNGQWTQARLDNGGTNTVELSSRVVLQLAPGKDLSGLLVNHWQRNDHD